MKILRVKNKRDIKISYCTACMNRMWQLKETLPYNLDMLRNDEEICLVNYNSTDDLDDWIRDGFLKFIESGKLVYFYTKCPNYFHASKAKNLSHRLSNGVFVFNLDADNFIIESTREKMLNEKRNKFILHEFKGTWGDGTYGRLGMRKRHFFDLGGYDESFKPMGYQDVDLKIRAKKRGHKVIRHITDQDISIKNTIEQKVKNTGISNYVKQNKYNKRISKENIQNYIFTCNKNGFSDFNGVLNFKEEIRI